MDLRNFIKTTIREHFNEQQDIENNLNNNFRKWFGNSKTIKNDKPIVFFHGTSNKFDEFSVKRRGVFGIGYYFTTDLKEAKGYGNKIMKVFLNIKNPATTKDVQDIMTNIPDVRYLDDVELANKTTEKLIESGFDGIFFTYPSGDSLAMVINSNQIKSIENDGTWDINDNNIYS
jgi:hypothetical protein